MHKINPKTSNHNFKLFVLIDQIHSHNPTRKQQNNYFISRVYKLQTQKSLHQYTTLAQKYGIQYLLKLKT